MRSLSDAAVATIFTRAEWDLLVRLPGQVVVAATSAEADSASRTVAEGLAGISAIAAGLEVANPLVRAVVATIYAERDPESQPTTEEFSDRAAGLAGVIRSCHAAAEILATRTETADSRAYSGWLLSIATSVCEASKSGGLLGIGGTRVGAGERAFLDDLSVAFGG
jgi:hypothetical protein